MSQLALKPIRSDCVNSILQTRPHLVQESMLWFEFLRNYSGEMDRSMQFEYGGRAIGFLLALQHRGLIQSLPFPAGYAGPVFIPGVSVAMQRECVGLALQRFAQYADVCSICSSPFGPEQAGWQDLFEFATTNTVHVLNLRQDPLAGTTSKFRNNLQRNRRKAAEAGVKITHSNGVGDLTCWYEVYRKRAAELGAPLLPLRFFEQMFQALGATNNCRLISARADTKYLGGIIVTANDHYADYFLSMFDREFDDLQASTAAFHDLLEWARQSGIRYLNLQASPAGQPDLVRFKASWGATELRQAYHVSILNNRDKVLQLSVDQIKDEYLFHFYIPFSALVGKSETVRDREVTHAI